MQKGNACGMVKHFCILMAFVEVQIKRQEKSARDERMQSCFQLSPRSPWKLASMLEQQGQDVVSHTKKY